MFLALCLFWRSTFLFGHFFGGLAGHIVRCFKAFNEHLFHMLESCCCIQEVALLTFVSILMRTFDTQPVFATD